MTEPTMDDVIAKCVKCGKYIIANEIFYGNDNFGYVCEDCSEHLTDEEIDEINEVEE